MYIAISSDEDDSLKKEARLLSQATGIPLHNTAHPSSFLLHKTTDYLELIFTKEPTLKPLFIDFLSGKNQHRRLYGGGKGQQLAKAIGLNKFKNPSVLDTTAGLGRDAFVLATLGCQVTLLERTLPVYLLLEDALSRARECRDSTLQEIIGRMTLYHADSQDYLTQLVPEQYPDVIYIDPMFPPRTKSAKVKKEMAIFHHLVGKDEDATQLLKVGISRAKKRIVIKRPRLADHLYSKPSFQIKGKSTRYDVYLPTA